MHNAVMRFHDLLHQSQSKPAPFYRPRQSATSTIEALEHFVNLFLLDANTEVLDSDKACNPARICPIPISRQFAAQFYTLLAGARVVQKIEVSRV